MRSWSKRSLSTWVTLGMTLTILPLVLSAAIVHVWMHGGAIASFDDVSARYRDEAMPLQRLQVSLWEAANPVEDYLDSREPRLPPAYRELRVAIDAGFTDLDKAFGPDESLRRPMQHAEERWHEADELAGELLAHPGAPEDPRSIEMLDRFNSRLEAAVDELHAVDREVSLSLDADHTAASRAFERSQWASGIAAGLSIILIAIGVTIIRRVMLANVARLVDGARRFAEGDRGHRIEVSVPPELREVADEFNRMIARICDAEQSLIAQARQDPMTGLGNRRAFDDAMGAALARMRRLDERFVLALLDVDHFKKINDTHGHAAGDEVLRALGKTIGGSLREVDQAFRIGGEEFAVLLVGADLPGAKVAAERLRSAIAATEVEIGGAPVPFTASLGLALAESTVGADELIASADGALYAAKHNGRNRVMSANESTPRRMSA